MSFVTTASIAAPPARLAGGVGLPLTAGAAGMAFVGGSVAASGVLGGAPLFTVQALRYALACVLLIGFARVRRVPLVAPRGTEWLWLGGVTAAGLVIFNVALVQGAQHAEPAVLGVAVSCVPLLLAVLGPMLKRHRPAPRVVVAALVVTTGAALVQGVGRSDGIGLIWAAVVLAGEAGFTLLAVPLLDQHGAVGVSVHTTWLAATAFAVLGVLTEGPGAVTRLHAAQLLAGAYLAVGVTAVAFVLWYTCVDRLGAGRAGLLTGITPVAAAVAGVALGSPWPRPLVWAGVLTVMAGLAVGLRHRDPDRS